MTDENPTPEPTTAAEDVEAHGRTRDPQDDAAEDVEAHGRTRDPQDDAAEDTEGHIMKEPFGPGEADLPPEEPEPREKRI